GVDPKRIVGREIHPARAGRSHGRREVPADESRSRLRERQLRRHVSERSIGAVSDDIRALKHVRRHQQIAGVDAPAFRLERSAYAGGAGEGIVHGAGRNSLALKSAENERKKPCLVSDVPHDAKEGEAECLALQYWISPCLRAKLSRCQSRNEDRGNGEIIVLV